MTERWRVLSKTRGQADNPAMKGQTANETAYMPLKALQRQIDDALHQFVELVQGARRHPWPCRFHTRC
jgi:hypothetical protein